MGTGVPWVVLTLHRMLYSTQLCEEADYANGFLLRKQLEATLRKYRVNLVLVGHQHSFERTCAVYDGVCVPDGVSTHTSNLQVLGLLCWNFCDHRPTGPCTPRSAPVS